MKKIEKINLKLDKISLVLSVLAVIISVYFGFKSNQNDEIQINLEKESTKSRIVTQIGRLSTDNHTITFKKSDSFFFEVYYKQKYELLINNLGQVNASLIHFNVSLETTMYPISNDIGYTKPLGEETSYSYINGDTVNLPITIKPNKPIKIIVEVGVKVPTENWNKLSCEIEFDKPYDFWTIDEKFMEIGHPIIGQLDKTDDNGYGDKGNLQKYFLFITKGDGKVIETSFSFFRSYHYLQGETDF